MHLKGKTPMPKIISIPVPCHEDWNAMTPGERGRHCAQCCKTVVDFTEWQPQEILFYLQQNAAAKVCGRFAPDQLNEPIPTPEDFVLQLSRFPMPFLKKAAAIFLFAFSAMMVSCTDNPMHMAEMGKIVNIDTSPQRLTGDTVIMEPPMGAPAIEQPVKVQPAKKCTGLSEGIKGDVAVIVEPPPLTGTVAITPVEEHPVPIAPIPDSLKKEQPIMGKVAYVPEPVIIPVKHTGKNKKKP